MRPLIDDRQGSSRLLALVVQRTTAGMARLNLANGEFILLEVPVEQIPATLEYIRPAEILHPESWTPEQATAAACTRQADWHFDVDSARRLLCEQFAVASLAGFEAEGLKPAIGAAGLCCERRRQSEQLPHLRGLTVELEATVLAWTWRPAAIWSSPKPCADNPLTLFSLLDLHHRHGDAPVAAHLHHPLRDRTLPATARHAAVAALLDNYGELAAAVRRLH